VQSERENLIPINNASLHLDITNNTYLKAFSNLGLISLNRINNNEYFFPVLDKNSNDDDQNEDILIIDIKQGKPISFSIKPIEIKKPIIAIDTSSIKIAENSEGFIIAIRGAIIQRFLDKISAYLIGPFPFFVCEENSHLIYNRLRNIFFGLKENVNPPLLEHISKRIGNLFDRWLQIYVAEKFSDSILLFDGSLTAGTIDSPISIMKYIIETAQKNNNIIMAFSKMTRLRIHGIRITEIQSKESYPYVINIDDCLKQMKYKCFGNIYVARLSPFHISYRLDIAPFPKDKHIEALGILLNNDAIIYGYPETLLLAHVLSTFNKIDVIGFQRLLASEFNFPIYENEDIRETLFQPF